MQFLGATIVAGVIFFILNFTSSMLLDGINQTTFGALIEATLKTGIFVVIFHYAHNWIAKLLGWYRIDNPDAKHTFDRNPALDQARAGEGGLRTSDDG